jgi:hypothetical protein
MYIIILILIILYEVIISLLPLMNDFLWKLLNINFANMVIIFEKYNLLVFILILLFFWDILIYILPLLLASNWSYWPLFMVLISTSKQISYNFHFLIGAFVWISLLSWSFMYTQWSALNFINNTSLINTIQMINTNYVSLNNLNIDTLYVSYVEQKLYQSWNTIWFDTTPEVYSFIFLLTKNISTQLMLIGTKLFTFSISVIDVLSTGIIFLYLSLSSIYIYYFYCTIKIVF